MCKVKRVVRLDTIVYSVYEQKSRKCWYISLAAHISLENMHVLLATHSRHMVSSDMNIFVAKPISVFKEHWGVKILCQEDASDSNINKRHWVYFTSIFLKYGSKTL